MIAHDSEPPCRDELADWLPSIDASSRKLAPNVVPVAPGDVAAEAAVVSELQPARQDTHFNHRICSSDCERVSTLSVS